jgi:hypothetical protein
MKKTLLKKALPLDGGGLGGGECGRAALYRPAIALASAR